MRIGFLCKRLYMGKDVIVDRYARLYEFPYQLARLGHDVLGLCLSYQGHDEGHWRHVAEPGSLQWTSSSLGRSIAPGLLAYPASALKALRAFRPDLLIGASDIPHVAFGAWLSRRLQLPYAVDLYDNFEGFGQARLPGMKSILRRSVREAQLVTTTSEPLADFVRDVYGAKGAILPFPSTVDHAIFRPRDRMLSRVELGLPVDAQLIGTAGGLHRDKGIGTLYEAWERLSAESPNLHLVLAGPYDSAYPPPVGPRVHYLGQLAHARTAVLFGALDVGVIYIRETPFGRYCFPQKAYEMLACRLPTVAAEVGAMGSLFRSATQCLYEPDDAEGLANRIGQQLLAPWCPEVSIPDWEQLVRNLEPQLQRLVEGHTDRAGA